MFTAPVMQLDSCASKKYSASSDWHNRFYSLVTTKIDEKVFKPLFPEGRMSDRPNVSICVLVGKSILKEDYDRSNIARQSRYELIHTTQVIILKANNLLLLSSEQQEQESFS